MRESLQEQEVRKIHVNLKLPIFSHLFWGRMPSLSTDPNPWGFSGVLAGSPQPLCSPRGMGLWQAQD